MSSGVYAPDGKACDFIDTGYGCIVSWKGRIYWVQNVNGEPEVDFKNPLDFKAMMQAYSKTEQGCKHVGYNFKGHGRCCPNCGKFMVDWGD